MAEIQFNETEVFQLCLHPKLGSVYPHWQQAKQLPEVKIEVLELLASQSVAMRIYCKGVKDSTPFSQSERLFIEQKLNVTGSCGSDFTNTLPEALNTYLARHNKPLDYLTLKYVQKKLDIVFLVQYEDIETVLHNILEQQRGKLSFESCRSLFVNLLSGLTYPANISWSTLQRYFKHWESKNYSYDYFTFLEVIFALEQDGIIEVETIDFKGLSVPIFRPEKTYRYQLKDDYFFYIHSGMLMKLSNAEEPIYHFSEKEAFNYKFMAALAPRLARNEGLSFETIALEVYGRTEYQPQKEYDTITSLLKRVRTAIKENTPKLAQSNLLPTENNAVTDFFE